MHRTVGNAEDLVGGSVSDLCKLLRIFDEDRVHEDGIMNNYDDIVKTAPSKNSR